MRMSCCNYVVDNAWQVGFLVNLQWLFACLTLFSPWQFVNSSSFVQQMINYDVCCLFFQAEIRRRMIGDREFEVYRVLLDEGESLSIPRSKILEAVWNMLMGWA